MMKSLEKFEMDSDNMNLNIMQPEGTELTNKTSTSDMEKCYINNNDCQSSNPSNGSRRNLFLDLLSEIYPEILVVLAAIAVFTETLHGHVPLFHLHVYVYFYLLGIGIIIFFSIFVIDFTYKFCQINTNLESDFVNWKFSRYLNVVKLYKFGLVACGLTALLCSCLESVTVSTSPSRCSNTSYQAFSVLHSTFIAFQLLFFLINFKSSRIFCYFHKLVVMHLIAVNAALWFHTVLFASSNDWQEAIHIKHNSSLSWGQNEINISMHSLEFDVHSDNHTVHLPKHAVHVTSNCWWRVPDVEISDDILSVHLCLRNASVGALWSYISQTVYPVTMQFYLIVCFTLYASWKTTNSSPRKQSPGLLPNPFQCRWFNLFSSKGFISGSIIFITTSVFAILHNIKSINFITITSLSCILFGISGFATILGIMQIKSSFTYVNQNFFFICLKFGLISVYIFSVFNILVGFIIRDEYSLFLSVQSLLMVVHAFIQYVFIKQLFALPLSCLSKVRSKQVIIFLVFCNASFWVTECFMFWNDYSTKMQVKVYGSIVWPIVMRIFIPCLGFYHFHSAVMLVEAWRVLNIGLLDTPFY